MDIDAIIFETFPELKKELSHTCDLCKKYCEKKPKKCTKCKYRLCHDHDCINCPKCLTDELDGKISRKKPDEACEKEPLITENRELYGTLGVRKEMPPFIPGVMCITAIKKCTNMENSKFIYGDCDSSYIQFNQD